MKLGRLSPGHPSIHRAAIFTLCLIACAMVFLTNSTPHFLQNPRSAADETGLRAQGKIPVGSLKPGSAQDHLDPAAQARVVESYSGLPLSFEVNLGQTDSRVKFLSRGRGYTLFLTGDEAVLSLRSQESEIRSENGKSKFETRNWQEAVRPWSVVPSPLLRAPDGLVSGSIANRQSTIGNSPESRSVVRLKLMGANPGAKVVGLRALSGKSNYFLGNDPIKWHTQVPNFTKVKYEGVYPGIDLVYYGNQGKLEYDFVVAPGADPRAITLGIETGNPKLEARTPNPESRAPNPSEAVHIDLNGDLVIALGEPDAGEVRFHKPVVYQEQLTVDSRKLTDKKPSALSGRHSARRLLASSFIIHRSSLPSPNPESRSPSPGYVVAFEIPVYDRTRPLVIDPLLAYSSYLGGTLLDGGIRIAVDNSGDIYVAGLTGSSNFPTTAGAYRQSLTPGSFPCGFGGKSFPCPDLFVTKLNPSGSAFSYSTYIGGTRDEAPLGLAVDSSGNAYLAGFTSSSDFPTTPTAYQPASLGTGDAFVTRLNANGNNLDYSTYLGGSGDDGGTGLALDASGNAFITGITFSGDFPTTAGALQPSLTPGSCNFLGRVSACADAFVAELNSTGTGLTYATYLGGSDEDIGLGIAVDSGGKAYVTGATLSTDFPTLNPFQGSNTGGICGPSKSVHPCIEGFVAKLNTGGGSLAYSSYLGASGDDIPTAIAVDSAGSAYVAGVTNSRDFRTTTGAAQPTFGGGSCGSSSNSFDCPDAFVTKLDVGGNSLAYSTYLGGSNYDGGFSIAADSAGNAYVVGGTGSLDFPTAEPTQGTFGGGNCGSPTLSVPCPNAFFTKLSPDGSTRLFSTYHGGAGGDIAFGVALDATAANAFLTGATVSADYPTASPLQTSLAGDSDAFIARFSLPDFSIAVPTGSSTTATVTAGGTATYNLSLAPSNTFTGTVSLTCTGAPRAATCITSPTSVTVSGTDPVPFTVTVKTTAPSMVAPRPPESSPGPLGHQPLPLLFSILALLTMLTLASAARARAWPRATLPLAAILLSVLLWAACGGGGNDGDGDSGTPPGTYPLTVTATAASLSRSLSLSLTVN